MYQSGVAVTASQAKSVAVSSLMGTAVASTDSMEAGRVGMSETMDSSTEAWLRRAASLAELYEGKAAKEGDEASKDVVAAAPWGMGSPKAAEARTPSRRRDCAIIVTDIASESSEL